MADNQPALGSTQYYQSNTNGITGYQALAYAGNTPNGLTSISKSDYGTGLQNEIAKQNALQAAGHLSGQSSKDSQGNWYVGENFDPDKLSSLQKEYNDFQSGSGIHAPGYLDPVLGKFQGNTPSEANYKPGQDPNDANLAGVAAGTAKAVQLPGGDTGYVPTGSAGDVLSSGVANGTVNPQDPNAQMNASLQGNNVNAPGITPVSPFKAGLAAAQASGAPPQDSSSGISAANDFSSTKSPTFYKPDPNSPQVYDANGKALSHDEYIAAGGKADYSNVQSGQPPSPQSTPNVDNFLGNKGVTQQAQDLMDYLNPQATTDELTNQLSTITSDKTTLNGLNTDLMDINKVIAGTESDIRSEIQASGGFGTNSQVMALTAARNKTLLKQAKDLQVQITAQKNLVATDTSLYTTEKSLAQQQFNERSSALKMVEANNKNIDTANRSTYNTIVKNMGYAGLYASLESDPDALANAEQTLGLPDGGLKTLAKEGSGKTGTTVTYDKNGTQITTKNGVVTKTVQEKPKTGKGKVLNPNSSANLTSATNKVDGYIQKNTGKDGYISPQTYKSARAAWVTDGHQANAFDRQFSKYANPADLQDYRGN